MHKRELVARAARRTSATQVQTRETLDAIIEVIAEALSKGEPVTLTGLGRFELREYKGRRIRHPRTRRPYETKSRLLPAFHPYPALKRQVEEGRSQDVEPVDSDKHHAAQGPEASGAGEGRGRSPLSHTALVGRASG